MRLGSPSRKGVKQDENECKRSVDKRDFEIFISKNRCGGSKLQAFSPVSSLTHKTQNNPANRKT